MKYLTRSEAQAKLDQAVRFLENIGQLEKADEFREMTAEEYAEHRGAQLLDNPTRRIKTVAQVTKDELESMLDDVQEILEEAYHPEATREELAEAIGKALDVIEAEEEDEEEGEGDEAERGDEG